jgi:hypothetical protein
MNKLIKYFNENYGKEYGKISYPRTTIQIYRAYQAIKSYGIDDEKLISLLHDIKLPQPKTIEEKELYADCLYDLDDSELLMGVPYTQKIKILENSIPVEQYNGNYGYRSNTFDYNIKNLNIKNPSHIEIDIYYGENLNTEIEESDYHFNGVLLLKESNDSTYDFWSPALEIKNDDYGDSSIYLVLWIYKHGGKIAVSHRLHDDTYISMFFIKKISLSFYENKGGTIQAPQIGSVDARALINKEDGLSDYATSSNPVFTGKVVQYKDNAQSYEGGNGSARFGYSSSGENSFSSNWGSASEKYSFAANTACAFGEGCFAIGKGTHAWGENQFVFGSNNIYDKKNKYMCIAGNGIDADNTSNAYTLDWNGNAWYKGNISIDGAPTNDKDLTTKKYVDDYLSPLVKKVGEVTTQVAQEHVPTATTTYLNNMFNLVEIPITNSTLTLTSARNQTPTGGVMVDGTTIVLPEIDYFTEIHLFFKADANMNLTLPDIKYQMTTDIVGGKIYEFIFTHLNGLNEWIGGYVAYV